MMAPRAALRCRQRRLADQKDALQVGVDNPIPVGLAAFFNALAIMCAGVVDQNINRAIFADDFGYGRLHSRSLTDIGDEGRRPDASRLQLLWQRR